MRETGDRLRAACAAGIWRSTLGDVAGKCQPGATTGERGLWGNRGDGRMSEVSGIGDTNPAPSVTRRAPVAGQRPDRADYRTSADAVEISEVGAMLARLRELPHIRTELVERVRAQIDAGTYETPERLDKTVERILEELA